MKQSVKQLIQKSLLFLMLISAVCSLGSLKIESGSEEISATKRFKKEVEEIVCQKDLLSVFGLAVENPQETHPTESPYQLFSYCRKNKLSCCTLKETREMSTRLFKFLNEVYQILEPIEEVLTLFLGSKVEDEILSSLQDPEEIKSKNCQKYAVNPFNLKLIDFSSQDNYVSSKLSEARILISEFPFYLKKIGWLYGDLICTVCNPFNQKNFQKDENGNFQLKMSENTAIENFELYEFEQRFDALYGSFLKPLLDTFHCVQSERGEGLSDELVLPNLEWDRIHEKGKAMDRCSQRFDDECARMSLRSLTSFSISSATLKAYKATMNSIFALLTDGMEVEEFYRQNKLRGFEEGNTDSVTFLIVSPSSDKFSWKFESDGAHIYNNHFTKKEQEFSVEILQD